MARLTLSIKAGSQPKSGKPWPRLTALCSAASADMTVKMVVPTWGRRLGNDGVRAEADMVIRAGKQPQPASRTAIYRSVSGLGWETGTGQSS
jgi:hypothetical protein